MPPKPRRTWLTPLPVLLLAAGCSEPRNPGAQPAAPTESTEAPVVQPREVLGKTTQDIRPVETEVRKGAQVVEPKVTAKDPITLSGNVYVYAADRIATDNVKHALDLYQAEHGEYPRTTNEFMNEVIKPGKGDGIPLPKLPYYQEYGYDEKEHKLIILEYPARKAQLQKQEDTQRGR